MYVIIWTDFSRDLKSLIFMIRGSRKPMASVMG